jgi:hypothetical protein
MSRSVKVPDAQSNAPRGNWTGNVRPRRNSRMQAALDKAPSIWAGLIETNLPSA